MELLVVIGLFLALAATALCWGCESRDGFSAEPPHRRPGLF